MNPNAFRYAMLALTGITLALALSIMATAAHTLDVYNKNHTTNPWWLPLWSEHFDVHGTVGLIGSAVGVIILNGLNFILAFIPKLNLSERPTMRAFLTLAANIPSAIVTLSTFVFAHVLNKQSPNFDTIQTWTCRYSQNPPTNLGIQIDRNISNGNFAQLCQESKFALFGTLTVFLLQGVMVAFAVVNWAVDMWTSRKTKKEIPDDNSMEMSNGGYGHA